MHLREQRRESRQNEENSFGIQTRRCRTTAANKNRKVEEPPKPKIIELEKDTKEDLDRR